MEQGKLLRLIIAILAIVFGLQAMGFLVSIYPDLLWFRSLGLASVLWTGVGAKVMCSLFFGLLFALVFGANLMAARKAVGDEPVQMIGPDGTITTGFQNGKVLSGILLAVALLFGFMIGSGLTGEWDKWLLFLNGSSTGIADPVFGRDLSFFIFSLPFYKLVKTILDTGLFLSVVGSIWIYAVNRHIEITPGKIDLSGKVKTHFAVLAALIMVSFGIGRLMDGWDLLYSNRGVAFGASYTDVHANLPGLRITAFAAFAVAGAFLTALRGASLRRGAMGVVILVVINFLASEAYPAFVQKFTVKPNEITLEKPFIEQDLAHTRRAYGLDGVVEKSFEVSDSIQAQALEKSNDTVANIRLWDESPLMKTYKQLQEMRLYYDFESTFTDRYQIDGVQTQVVLSPRELNFHNVPEEAKTWVNEHIQYTHGHGVCISPVNAVTQDGLPKLLVKDIPPNSTVEAFRDLSRPEIYFGQLTNSWVIVDTSQDEFDYPLGDGNKYCRYAGRDGVSIGSIFSKLLFAMHFGDVQILTTNYLTSSSRILFDRNIRKRVEKIAPFLHFDGRPYMVAADLDGKDGPNGKGLYWIMEAYTVTDRYPYSRPRFIRTQDRIIRLNYIRNSVKVVIDAYNGDVAFYAMDQKDPILKAWAGAFPGLFKKAAEMPAALADHLRYPQYLFEMQADMYKTYHMTRAEVFYNQEDKWTFPRKRGGVDTDYNSAASYITFRLPGEQRAEFLISVPFTPVKKDNMLSLLVGRCDGDNYGKLVSYNFPKKKLVYGPMQIEARIDQQPEISKLMTLWGQQGSQVIRGEVTVIPVMDSLLYVQPIYLRASRGELPQLTSVVVADGERIAMASRLEDAMERLMNTNLVQKIQDAANEQPENETEIRVSARTPGAETLSINLSGDVKEMARRASVLLDQAGKAASRGDWTEYGARMDELKAYLAAHAGE